MTTSLPCSTFLISFFTSVTAFAIFQPSNSDFAKRLILSKSILSVNTTFISKINVILTLKMKIPNYDTKSPTQGRSLCDFLDEDFRMLVAGQTRCGKTNTVMHILRKPLVYYDKIIFYSPNQHQWEFLTTLEDLKILTSEIM